MADDNWFPQADDDNDLMGNIHQRTEELYRIINHDQEDDGTFVSPAFILKDVVVFPRMISPIFLSNESSPKAVDAAQQENQTAVALFLSDDGVEGDFLSEFLPVGLELAVGRMLSMQSGNHSALVQGRRRVEIVQILETEPYLMVKVRPVPENFRITRQMTALMRTARSLFENCVELNESLPEEAHLFSINIDDPSWLADMIATSLSLPNDIRKELMVLTHPADRLKRINQVLAEELDVLELEDEIHAQVQTEVDRSHREYYLREQMKAIQTELGEGDIWSQEILELS